MNLHDKWFWLKFCEAGQVVLARPSGCTFFARPAAASGVLVVATNIVHSARRTNRASILDAINQPPSSRNLNQNPVGGTVSARYLAVLANYMALLPWFTLRCVVVLELRCENGAEYHAEAAK